MDYMIILVHNPVPIGGEQLLHFDPRLQKAIDPPQPSIVLREATKGEYLAYWDEQDPEGAGEIRAAYARGSGRLPEYYYEVSTD